MLCSFTAVLALRQLWVPPLRQGCLVASVGRRPSRLPLAPAISASRLRAASSSAAPRLVAVAKGAEAARSSGGDAGRKASGTRKKKATKRSNMSAAKKRRKGGKTKEAVVPDDVPHAPDGVVGGAFDFDLTRTRLLTPGVPLPRAKEGGKAEVRPAACEAPRQAPDDASSATASPAVDAASFTTASTVDAASGTTSSAVDASLATLDARHLPCPNF